MSQHDFEIANQGFPSFRSDLNSGLQALASNSAGATEPSSTYAYQFWYDSTANLLKMRNGDDDAWITLAFFDQTNDEWEVRSAVIQAVDSAGIALKTDDGTTRFSISDAGVVSFENYAFPSADGTANQVLATDGSGTLSFASITATVYGLFRKDDPLEVAWTKTGNGTAESQTAIYVEVNGTVLTIASGTTIDMPSLSAGTDYAIWAETDGSLQASSNHTTPPSANARKVGGFHYAPGSNASGTSGGDTTAQINEYSFWDLKFKPSCPDPRGMTLVADAFWSDIYLTGVDHHTNGTSKYNVTIADGSSPPKVPSKFGGNGSTTYGSYKWFEACELMVSHGKRLPTQREFMALAYGTEEETSVGSDPVSTAIAAADADHTSKWGVMQSTGCMWVWGDDRAGPYASAAWNDNLEDRGEEYNAPNAARFGGGWVSGADAGSRCSAWNNSVSVSNNTIGSRGVCDHLILE